MPTRTHPLLTVEDLLALPDDDNHRHELIEGELIVSCNPSLNHQRILRNLVLVLQTYLDQNPIGEAFPTPGVILDKHNSVIPDVVFLTSEQLARVGSEPHIHEGPALAVEIVSPGRENARRDRVVKLETYGKFRVGEYWIVDPDARTVEIYRPAGGALALAETLKADGELTSPALPGFTCRLEKLFGK
jgi:Uma2 family endonuclease